MFKEDETCLLLFFTKPIHRLNHKTNSTCEAFLLNRTTVSVTKDFSRLASSHNGDWQIFSPPSTPTPPEHHYVKRCCLKRITWLWLCWREVKDNNGHNYRSSSWRTRVIKSLSTSNLKLFEQDGNHFGEDDEFHKLDARLITQLSFLIWQTLLWPLHRYFDYWSRWIFDGFPSWLARC